MGILGRTTELPLTKQWSGSTISRAPLRQMDPRSGLLQISLIVVALSLFFVLTCFFGLYTTALNAVSIMIFFYAATIILTKDSELRGNPFHPLSLFIIILSLNYGFRALTIEALGLQVDAFHPGSSLEHLPLACLLVTVFLVLCYGGFRSGFGFWLARTIPLFSFSNDNTRPRQLLVRAYILAMIGILARADLIANGVIHVQVHLEKTFLQYAQFVTFVSQFTTFAIAAAFGLVLLKKVSPLWLAPLLLTEIILGLRIGQRFDLFFLLLYGLALYSYYLRPVRWRHVFAGMALLIFVIVPLSYVWQQAYFKSVIRYRGTNATIARSSGSETLVHPLARLIENPDIKTHQLATLGRFGELDMLLKVLDRVPRLYPFQRGDTFIPYFLVFPIPRFLWPSKPFLDANRKTAILFGDDAFKGTVGTSAPIGPVAELYFNFGYLGLALSPFFGIVIRFYWERWKYYSHTETCASIRMPFIIIQTAMFDTGLAGYLIGLILGPAVAYLFMILFYGRLPTLRRLPAVK